VSAAEVVLKALKAYLKVHGDRVASLAELTGQREVVIEVRALYRYHEPSARYPRLEAAIHDLVGSGGRLADIGEVIVNGRAAYVRLPVAKLRELQRDP